jgi:uncharacterized protein
VPRIFRLEDQIMIIDVHSHLGDILDFDGGALIWKTDVTMPRMYDPQALNERLMMRDLGLGRLLYPLIVTSATRAERARNSTATLENMRSSLGEAGIDYTVCLPIEPYVGFDDLAKATEKEPRILPFTSVNFEAMDSMEKKLRDDAGRGAYGLKLHPVIQRISPLDDRVSRTLETFAQFKKPVLVHAGKSEYYLGDERKRNNPEFGAIGPIAQMIKNFPGISFIVGHSGLFWHREVCARLAGAGNVWVDTSFQSPGTIRRLVMTFGPERVMYASDWPYGMRPPHCATVRAACRGDKALERMLFHENAASLLRLKA